VADRGVPVRADGGYGGQPVRPEAHPGRAGDLRGHPGYRGGRGPAGEGGRLLAILGIHTSTPRALTADELALIEETAERTRAAVERARAEAALRESEENYRTLFTAMDQGFCVIEKIATAAGEPSDYRYVTVNPAFERHTGMRDVVGKTVRQFVPDAEQAIMDRYDMVVSTRTPKRFEAYVSALDLWMEAEVFPVGTPGQIAVLFSNVSERKRSEAALGDSERRLRATQNNVGVGIHELDELGRYVRMNETFTRLSGYTLEDFAGRTIFDGITDDRDREVARERYGRLLRGELDSYVEERAYVTKDGRRAWVEVQTTAVRDDEGRFLYAVRAVHDVTQRRHAEEALRESEERLQLALDASEMGTFVWHVEEDRAEFDARMLALFGRPPNGPLSLAEAFATTIHPDDRDAYAGAVASSTDPDGDGRLDEEIRVVHPDGEVRWLIITGRTVFGGAPRRAVLMHGVAADITERKRAEEERDLSEARELAARVEVEEAQRRLAFYAGAREERKMISRELHDRVAHSMAVVRQCLELYEAFRDRNPQARRRQDGAGQGGSYVRPERHQGPLDDAAAPGGRGRDLPGPLGPLGDHRPAGSALRSLRGGRRGGGPAARGQPGVLDPARGGAQRRHALGLRPGDGRPPGGPKRRDGRRRGRRAGLRGRRERGRGIEGHEGARRPAGRGFARVLEAQRGYEG